MSWKRADSSYEEMTAEEALNTLELHSINLNDLDGVIDLAASDDLVMSILKRDANLKDAMEQHEQQLNALEEEFIDDHCAQIDSLCELYQEVSECESKLVSFEEQISGFQSRLTDTAEGIVSMQRETLKVKQKLDNRKDVSHRIKEVYDALNECDTFCDKIMCAREVDGEFLDNIRHLAKKISFLANNPELEGSAVDHEIRAPLVMTAQHAGEKLFRFLVKKFQGFLEEGTNVALQQQAVEKQGQYAFSFLYRFNHPVATELMAHYVRVMAEVYTKQLKGPLKELCETTGFSGKPFDGVISPEMKIWAQRGADGGALFGPSAARAHQPGPGGANSDTSSRRSTSMSMEQRFDQLKYKALAKMDGRENLQEASFEDNLNAIKAVDVSYRLITLNPVHMMPVERTTCWVARLNQIFMRLVNNAINEGRFISHFFFVMGPSPEDEEMLLRRVFDRLHSDIQSKIASETSSITCPVTILAAMRSIELFKNYITSSADAMPLLLLGEVFDVVSSAFRKRIDVLLKQHRQLLVDFSGSVKLKAFPAQEEDSSALLQLISKTQGLQTALGPHEVSRKFALIGGQLDYVNTVRMIGSRVSAAEGRRCFDDNTDILLCQSLKEVRKVVEALAHRHTNKLAMSVFLINNYAHILLRFNSFETENASSSNPSSPSRGNSDFGSSFAGVANAASGGAAGGGGGPAATAEGNSQSASPTTPSTDARLSCVGDLERMLRAEVQNFVRLIQSTSQLSRVFDFVKTAENRVGAEFFSAESTNEAPNEAAKQYDVEEQELLNIVNSFNRGWQEQLSNIYANLRLYFTVAGSDDNAAVSQLRRSVTPASGRASSMAPAPVASQPSVIAPLDTSAATHHTNEVSGLVMREFVHILAVVNSKLHKIANTYYPKHSGIQAKLVGNLALTHGAAKFLRPQQSQHGENGNDGNDGM